MAGNGLWVAMPRLPDCDIHRYDKLEPGVPAAYDGKTKRGPWANMCQPCFDENGVGLGVGRGQRLVPPGHIALALSIVNRYELFPTVTTEAVVAVPPPPADPEERDLWAFEHIHPATGMGRTQGDSWYDVTVTASSDEAAVPVGTEFAFGY